MLTMTPVLTMFVSYYIFRFVQREEYYLWQKYDAVFYTCIASIPLIAACIGWGVFHVTVGYDPTLASDFLPIIPDDLYWSPLGWGSAQILFVAGVAFQVFATICFGIGAIFYFAERSPSEASSLLFPNEGVDEEFTGDLDGSFEGDLDGSFEEDTEADVETHS